MSTIDAKLERRRENARKRYHADKDRHRAHQDKYRAKNPAAHNARSLKSKNSNLIRTMLSSANFRANTKGMEFSVSEADFPDGIPEVCPVLGIPIYKVGGRLSDNSPTIDRVDNSKGYISGNVVIISYRANALKKDASLAELEAVVAYVKRTLIP